jgi:nucleotide-binding universal stress UspA family protein
MFEHIAVGCDGGAGGRDAVALGAAIASATGGRLSLVGVFPPSFLPVPGVTDRRTLRAQVNQALRGLRDQRAPGASVHTVADMSTARALRHFAERRHADLLVVGSSHTATPGQATIGRTGRQLIYDSPFGVAVAERGLDDRRGGLRTIGIGYDAGPEAQAALATAAALAGAARARLLVQRVVEDRVPVLSGDAWIMLADWSHDEIWADEREAALAEAQAAVTRLEVPAEVFATVGDPGYELRALSNRVDLIVVGSRRWGPVARLVTGGVGETLVAGAGCSILIVPRPPGTPRGRRAARRRAGTRPLVAAQGTSQGIHREQPATRPLS